jgi:hypothetical protein
VIAFDYTGVERRLDCHQIEFWLLSLVRVCRQLTNRRLIPSRIRLVHHRKKTPAEFRSLLGCEIEFGSGVDELVFPGAATLMPIGSADSHLNELLIKYCEEALAHRAPARTTLRSSVENAMAPLLPHGKANAVEIARRIGMSHRTLARGGSSRHPEERDVFSALWQGSRPIQDRLPASRRRVYHASCAGPE